MSTYGHAGDVGDLIYSLPLIRAKGVGAIRLRPQPYTREPMTPAKAESIASLLRLQPYIGSCTFGPGQEDYDLDWFRMYYDGKQNLAIAHGVPWGIVPDIDTPWLTAPRNPISPVIIHRSPRYQNPAFPWGRIMAHYRNLATFIGSPDEHEAFEQSFGPIPYLPTPNFFTLAATLNAAALFIGNQSAPFAVAEGLKVPVIQETWTVAPNCIFPRLDAQHVTTDSVSLAEPAELVRAFQSKNGGH